MKDTSPPELYFAFNPALGGQSLAAWNALQQEFFDFAARRAQACVKWPTDVARCRSPQDVWQEQMRFVKDMVSDCETAGQRLMVVFGSANNSPESLTQ
jgi:hypothetical protein